MTNTATLTRSSVTGPANAERFAAAVELALLHRDRPRDHKLSADAREFAPMDLVEIARASINAQGGNTKGLIPLEIADIALAGAARSGGLSSTADFPSILANVATKTLRAGYDAEEQTFRPFIRETTAKDFRPITSVQIGEAPALERVGEYGEFKRGTIAEGKETYSLLSYGKIVGITRQTIVNDDLGAFTRIPRSLGMQAANLESDLVWREILVNPTMSDGQQLFSAAHSNIGTAAGINVDSVAAAFETMRLQKGYDGKTRINIQPRFLVVPVAAEAKAEQLVEGAVFASSTASVVPARLRKLEIIAEPRLDLGMVDPLTGAPIAGSRFPWMLIADPDKIDTVELAHLRGQQGAFIETRTGFDIDGIEIKVRLDAAAKAVEWRGMFRNPAVTL